MASISESNARERQLSARLEDHVRRAEDRCIPGFIGFLDAGEAAVLQDAIRRLPTADVECRFYGGYPEAERVMLGVFPSFIPADDEAFPLTAVAFVFRKQADITHRDVLGSLIGCGVRREKIGDILCAEGIAVAFVSQELAPFLAETVCKIGREGVTVQSPYTGGLPAGPSFRPIGGTVASARLDSIVKVLLGSSREQAARRIEAALVSVNHRPELSVRAEIKAGDRISVRGVGRFVVDDVSAVTKKGRLILTARQYL